MRQIESEMLGAIRDGRDKWSKANMLVTTDGAVYPFTHAIYLHGNHIADAWADCAGKIYAEPDRETLEAWPTRTTQSRLWALGINVSQRDHWVYINDDRICEAR